MKKNFTILLFILLITVLCLTACNSGEHNFTDKVKVTFNLEGGTYKESDKPVIYYFSFEKGTQNLIRDMFDTELGYTLKRNGYEVEGWYTTKNEDGTYDNKWNFETDTVGDDGVTLYAKWQPSIKHTYQIYWYNAPEGAETKIGNAYVVSAGKTFSDTLNNATRKKPTGYTFLRFVDEQGNDWDDTFTHPGGETDCEVKVYAEYIEGNWTMVRTASELKKSAKMSNVYLLNDIDMEGASFSFGDYSKKLEGNGYTISNFTVAYDATKTGLVTDTADGTANVLYVSMFGNMKNAEIHNVKFDNVTLDVNATFKSINRIHVSPLCVNATDSTVDNVTVNFNYTCTATPWDDNTTAKEENYVTYLTTGYGLTYGTTTITNVAVTQSNR